MRDFGVLLATAALCSPAIATADEGPVDVRAQALQLAREAASSYAAGAYEEALGKFESAYRIYPTSALALDLSRVELKLGHCDRALEDAQTYGAAFGPSGRVSTESAPVWLATVKAHCPEVEITSDPPGAKFRLEGIREAPAEGTRRIHLTEPFVTPWKSRLPAGEYSVLARLAGFPDKHARLTVPSNGTARLTLSFVPAAPEPAGEAPPRSASAQPVATADAPRPPTVLTAPSTAEQPTIGLERALSAAKETPAPARRLMRNMGWAGVAAGAVALGVGLGLGVAGHAQQVSVHTSLQPNAAGVLNEGNAKVTGADVLFGAGGVLGAVGTGLLVAF